MSSGKFHFRLNRADTAVDDLPALVQADLVEEPGLTRRDWQESVNEVKVQYSERIWSEVLYEHQLGESATPPNNAVGRWYNGLVTTFSEGVIQVGWNYPNWNNVYAWIRFPGINIPGGMDITDASLTMYLSSIFLSGSANAKIYGVKQLSPDAPASRADALSRPLTSAYAEWSLPTTTGWKTTPDMAAIMEEVVKQPGWLRNNAVMFYLRGEEVSGNLVTTFSFSTTDYTINPRLSFHWTRAGG